MAHLFACLLAGAQGCVLAGDVPPEGTEGHILVGGALRTLPAHRSQITGVFSSSVAGRRQKQGPPRAGMMLASGAPLRLGVVRQGQREIVNEVGLNVPPNGGRPRDAVSNTCWWAPSEIRSLRSQAARAEA